MEELREGYTTYNKKEPSVRREDNAGLAQSESKTAEEINLIRKIESRTHNLIQVINSIESLTNSLNKNLLPQPPKSELECHLADLDHALHRCGQIYKQVGRLTQATKTDKVG